LFLGLPSGEFLTPVAHFQSTDNTRLDDEELGGHSTANGKVVSKLEGWYEGMYPQMTPSQRSTLTDTSLPDQLFSKLSEVSETEGHVTEPPRKSTDALPDILSSPALDYVRKLKRPLAQPSHLSGTLVQLTYKVSWTRFLDPQPQIRKPSLGHGPSATTRVPTGTRYFPNPVAVAEKLLQMQCLPNENTPGLILVSCRVAYVFISLLTNPDAIPHFPQLYCTMERYTI